MGRWHRWLLFAGPWEVTVISGRCWQYLEHLAVATAGHVHSQGSDSNNGWCLVAVPFCVPVSEVIGVTGSACSWTPSSDQQPPQPEDHTRSAVSHLFPLPLAHARGAQPPITCTRGVPSPIAGTSGTLPTVACDRGALLSESPHVCMERYSYGSPPLVLSPSPTMAPCFSCRPRPSLSSLG